MKRISTRRNVLHELAFINILFLITAPVMRQEFIRYKESGRWMLASTKGKPDTTIHHDFVKFFSSSRAPLSTCT